MKFLTAEFTDSTDQVCISSVKSVQSVVNSLVLSAFPFSRISRVPRFRNLERHASLDFK
jgi:hypothetical protein